MASKFLYSPTIFAIDIAAYAIMSHHYHTVLHINSARAKSWSDLDVIEYGHQLFSGTVLSNKYLKDVKLPEAEVLAFQTVVDEWRLRLQDISWFMRVLNEAIAREANTEDEYTGRFWEGRF